MMKSPFPGMDPYLEARWPDVHASLIGLIREALQPKLPSDLRARAEERVLLEELGEETTKGYRSDVAVVESPRPGGARAGAGAEAAAGATAVAEIAVPEPYLIRAFTGPLVDRFVQIIDGGNRVVTAIEILSPWNKAPGRLNTDYRRKLKDYERAGVNVVEIDFLRSPRGRLAVLDVDLPPARRTPYLICVQRAAQFGQWEVYSIPLRQRIPPIRVPLREQDADVILDLHPLMERVYVGGGHDDIDYSKPPFPPLDPDDEAWADDLLRQAGRR